MPLLLALSLFSAHAAGHGGVAFEDDICVINVDFLTAHFTVYQPENQGNREFCEDIPDVSESIFVMEYLHDFLRRMPVDFRIIRDVNEVGIYAKWEDVAAIDDLEAATVYYQPPEVRDDGLFQARYEFEQKGSYIGIVTAENPDNGQIYRAVFHFQTGGADLGTLPLFILLLVFLQGLYWASNGGWKRLRRRFQHEALPVGEKTA